MSFTFLPKEFENISRLERYLYQERYCLRKWQQCFKVNFPKIKCSLRNILVNEIYNNVDHFQVNVK